MWTLRRRIQDSKYFWFGNLFWLVKMGKMGNSFLNVFPIHFTKLNSVHVKLELGAYGFATRLAVSKTAWQPNYFDKQR